MASSDLYAVLGLERSASDREIKSAYKKLAMKHHPDRNPGNHQAEERFKEVSRAFEVLGDKDKRKAYDEFGEEGLRPGFDPERARAYQQWANRGGWSWQGGGAQPGQGGFGVNFNDFSGRGGGAGGFGGAGMPDLEDLLGGMFGGMGRRRPAARGPVGRPGRDVETTLEVQLHTAINGEELALQLDAGGGAGPTTLRVRVPAGVNDGSKIRLKGRGEPGLGGQPAGDLLIVVKLQVAAPFERQGDDLLIDLPVTLLEAVRGGQVPVPVPEGGEIKVKVPARSQSGDRLRVRGKGLPKGPDKGRGNLLVRLLVRLPDAGFRLEKMAEELEPLYGDVRAGLKPSS